MAEDSAQEKELPASQKRKQQAREKGQVARSRDLTSSLLLLGMAAVIYLAGGWFYDMGRELLQTGLTVSAAASQDSTAMLQAAGRVLVLGAFVLAPVLLLTFVASAA
ncbi:MAG: EscU/YscU/HrcU family type III secretion system export apparatus switch protein, partial [Thiomonas sp.]